jgi:acetyl esterase/lipase
MDGKDNEKENEKERNFQESSVRLIPNVTYNEGKCLDIYLPPKNMNKPDGGYPVLFMIHGGAWMLGSKENNKNVCENLSNEGYVTVSTSYSLSDISTSQLESVIIIISSSLLLLALTASNIEQTLFTCFLLLIIIIIIVFTWLRTPRYKLEHPQHILDIADSFGWTVNNIDKYDGNKDQIFVMGHSAGGHLASLLCTNMYYVESKKVDPSFIKGCISISGVYSDKRLQSNRVGKSLLTNTFGSRNQYYDAFPIYNVTEDTPPFLLINAAYDITLKAHTLDFHYTLRQMNVFVETAYFDTRNHFNIMHEWGRGQKNREVLKKIKQFIDESIEYYNMKKEQN